MSIKRTQHINLGRMRKVFQPKPLAIGVATVFVAGCADNRQEATIYTSAQECAEQNPQYAQECKTAYEEALVEAQRTAPKYNTERDCESEFGNNQCYAVQQNQGSIFMPLMAGYMLGNLLSPSRYFYQPMFTSYSPYSSMRYRWLTADGYDVGDIRKRNMRVSPKVLKPKPTVTRTISRGGFGSSVRAKSSWGSSSRKSGWGG